MESLEKKEHEKKFLEAARKKLVSSLYQEYGDIPIVSLHELCQEIKVVPSVRSGDKDLRDCTYYYEVSPTKLDEYDELIVERDKELSPANSRLLIKYRLKRGDLLVSYRGCKRVLIGRFEKDNLKNPVVAAVSNIRISFHDKDMYAGGSFSLLVHKYLTSELAQTYLRARTDYLQSNQTNKRCTLSKSYLAGIPIPNFRVMLQTNPLKTLYYKHKEKQAFAKELSKTMQILNDQINAEDEAMLSTYFRKNEQLPEIVRQEEAELKQLKKLQKQAEMFLDNEQLQRYRDKIKKLEDKSYK